MGRDHNGQTILKGKEKRVRLEDSHFPISQNGRKYLKLIYLVRDMNLEYMRNSHQIRKKWAENLKDISSKKIYK